MTKYAVTVEDKQYTIDITKTNNENHFAVKVNDKPREVELAKNKFEYGVPLSIKIGEKTCIVQIAKTSKQAPFLVTVRNVLLKAEVKTPLPTSAKQITETTTPPLITMKNPVGKAVVEGAVTAPMAGKIVAVKVRKGDSVKAGAVLCILEAMKMENEIVAPKAGTVQEINVSEGTTVNEGQVLLIVKSE